jgi:hypothetical protein
LRKHPSPERRTSKLRLVPVIEQLFAFPSQIPIFVTPSRKGMKREELRFKTTAIGILVALAVVVSQFSFLPQKSFQKKETKTEQSQSEESDQHVYVSAPTSTAPSSAHVELNPNVFFLFEIILEHTELESYDFDVSLPLSQCFRTLFGLAISPNAP